MSASQLPPDSSPARQYDPLFHVVLYEPEIPHNTGAIGRTCVAAACKLWLVKPLGFLLDDYYLRRAGLDYWPYLEWGAVENWEELLQALPNRRMWFFTKRGSRSYTDAEYFPGDVLVFGNESKGLPEPIIVEYAAHSLRIPMRPQTRSMNLSNCAAIAVYEGLRQQTARLRQ